MEPSPEVKYKPGDSLTCRIEGPEPGGFLVTLLPTGIQGFLPSHEPLEVGAVVPSTFICMNEDKALLSFAFMIGTTERVQFSTASDSENAFSIWVDSQPSSERVKRAVDLIMPPLNALPASKKLPAEEAERFIAKLEQDSFTGCLKVDSQARPSRSAALFYKGRAVGGIYTRKMMRDPYPIEASLMLMVQDIRHADTEIEYYSLPDEFVLSLSSLFLGVTIDMPLDTTNEKYAATMLAQFKKRKSTACLSMQQVVVSALCFICNGKYEGCYSVEDRAFRPDDNYLQELIKKFPTAQMHAHILPEAITSQSMAFGYSLTSEPFVDKAN